MRTRSAMPVTGLKRYLGVAVVAAAVAGCSAAPSPSPTPVANATAPTCADLGFGGAFIYTVRQQSMERTLEPGDKVLVVPGVTPKWSDVVVFNPPKAWVQGGPQTAFIKRVIGMAGETVEVKDGAVYVDGTELVEPYVYEQQPTSRVGETARWVIAPGELFVLGDHREASADSRAFGPITLADVLGVVTERCP
jgi:signal peptidase I